MKETIAAFMLIACTITGYSQKPDNERDYLKFDYQLVLENDAFALDFNSDRYYSSGIFPAFRWLPDSGSTTNTKVIRGIQLNHRIYTPYWVGWQRDRQLDRPYAGLLSATYTTEYYFRSNQYLKAQLELGWMGPGSRVGQTQITWHNWFGMPQPRGWQYQINNTPVINAFVTYLKPIYSSYNFEITSESRVAFGTIFNYGRQQLLFRAGKLKPLYQSAYSGASLGNTKPRSSTKSTAESYIFYAPGFEYVLYNATIEGNMIGTPSLYTRDQVNTVFQHKAGVMFSWPRFDFGVTAYWRTRENVRATRHKYVGVRLNQRF